MDWFGDENAKNNRNRDLINEKRLSAPSRVTGVIGHRCVYRSGCKNFVGSRFQQSEEPAMGRGTVL